MLDTGEEYQYGKLSTSTSFRVAELLAGSADDPVCCRLHFVNWSELPAYEAVSYAWGNPKIKSQINCHDKRLSVTKNLYSALVHFRFENRSRFLWADALCINQDDVLERNQQVRQMRQIYLNAKAVVIWLGPDTQTNQATIAVDSIFAISDFLSLKLGISFTEPRSSPQTYQELLLSRREALPLPDQGEFSSESTWNALSWFYSHPYYTRVWAVQEVNANKERFLYCGRRYVEWDRVDLVASYIIMEPTFSRKFGFKEAHCWWTATMPEMAKQSKNWLSMLYLASNFFATDTRDVVYGLRGMMEFQDEASLLVPDYNKSKLEVYQDCVEAAIRTFNSVDVLLYVSGEQDSSWIPRWDKPMLFRNPFRFGNLPPWAPAKDSRPTWRIDEEKKVLYLGGKLVGNIQKSAAYNQKLFSNTILASEPGKQTLRNVWPGILDIFHSGPLQNTIHVDKITAAATALSFGLNETSEAANEAQLTENFVAYLKAVLDETTFSQYVPSSLSEKASHASGHTFGKPVWDFEYPESCLFVTTDGQVGCCISLVEPGDIVFIAAGCTYPLVLRPRGTYYLIRGYAFVHRTMLGERWEPDEVLLEIH